MFPLPREACPGGPTPFTWVNPRKESAILALQIEYVHGRGYVQWVVNGFSEWLQLTRCGALSRQRRGRASTASMWVPQVINRMPRNSPRTVKGTALWSTTLLITTSRLLIELAETLLIILYTKIDLIIYVIRLFLCVAGLEYLPGRKEQPDEESIVYQPHLPFLFTKNRQSRQYILRYTL